MRLEASWGVRNIEIPYEFLGSQCVTYRIFCVSDMLGHLGGKENWHSIDIILFSSYAWRLLAGRSAARKKMKYGKGSGRRCFGGGEIQFFPFGRVGGTSLCIFNGFDASRPTKI